MKIEVLVRLSGFLTVLGLMASWEMIAPRRCLTASKARRWIANISVVVIDTVIVRLLFSAGAVGAAMLAADQQWGLLNQVSWPQSVEVVLAVVALDFVLYLQHVMLHAIPLFWRFHMMHHADLDCDVTTGLLFHPVEVTLSMLIKLAAIVVLGPSPLAVLLFEVLLNATSMFNHSNVRMPAPMDRALRWLVVTPDMHRVHHSLLPRETNTNFGFNLPWWDRLLGTYRPQPAAGHEGMTLGLEQFREPARLTITGILLLPFVGVPGNYPLSRDL
ncbi:MAG: sterol desaturase family protein [Nitrospira defluvii]|nr:sterol desaturase family protein [Nitrospira defluvii]